VFVPINRQNSCRVPAARTGNREIIGPLDHWMNQLFGTVPTVAPQGGVKQSDTEYMLKLDVPGFEGNEFDIRVREKTLVVKAEHKLEDGSVERTFERAWELPEDVVGTSVEAGYRNGVLSLKLPKAAKPDWQKIEVK